MCMGSTPSSSLSTSCQAPNPSQKDQVGRNDSIPEQGPSLRTATQGDQLLYVTGTETGYICLMGKMVLGPAVEQAASPAFSPECLPSGETKLTGSRDQSTQVSISSMGRGQHSTVCGSKKEGQVLELSH